VEYDGWVYVMAWNSSVLQANPFPGLENDFGLPFADKLTAEQRTKYRIVSRTQIEASFAARLPRVVVVGNQNPSMQQVMQDTARNTLVAHGYTLARSIGDSSIYICCSKQ